jgi:hypothetical protein
MSDSPMPWVKLHTRLLDDPRFGRLPDSVRVRYYDLLMLAGQCDAGGAYFKNGEQLTNEEIAFKLHVQPDILLADLEKLKASGYMSLNGHGWEINLFDIEQGPSQEEKRTKWAERQNKHRHALVTRDTAVTPASQSQSQSQEKESESDQTDSPTDVPSTLTKADLCKLLGFGGGHAREIVQDSAIKTADILAELVRNIQRTGVRKGQVRNPKVITCLNLLKHEFPAKEFYSKETWTAHLPEDVLQKLGLAHSETTENENHFVEVTTRISEENQEIPEETGFCPRADETVTPEIAKNWQLAIEWLQHEIPKSSFDNYVCNTSAIHWEDDQLTIACETIEIREWLESHLTSTAMRLLVGIMNRNVSINFVVVENTNAN